MQQIRHIGVMWLCGIDPDWIQLLFFINGVFGIVIVYLLFRYRRYFLKKEKPK